MTKTLSLTAFLCLVFVVPAAHAVEPSAAPKNPSQWCTAWKSGSQLDKLNTLFPGNAGYVTTFTTKAGNGHDKTNIFGRCVSMTAKKLAAAKAKISESLRTLARIPLYRRAVLGYCAYTAAIGALLTVAAGLIFVRVPSPAQVWQPVLGSAVMGAGLGLIMSPLIVGLQSTVGWTQRGVVTGGAMFSRFLGQSIGAAVFGAVTNAVLAQRLRSAPADVRGRLPSTCS